MYNCQTDMVTLEYITESDKEYTMAAETSAKEGRLKVARKDVADPKLYDHVREIGTRILIKWKVKDVKEMVAH